MDPTKKTFPVEVAFEGYDWRNEFRVRSLSTGRTVTVYCNGKWGRFSEALTEAINAAQKLQWASYPMHKTTMTGAVMIELLRFEERNK